MFGRDTIEEDEDGIRYLLPSETELALRGPPRRTGRLPATPEEVSGWKSDVVPMHWLLDDLSHGARRGELEAFLASATPELSDALGYQLAVLFARGDEPRAYLHHLAHGPLLPAAVRAVVKRNGWEVALLRETDRLRVAQLEAEPVPRPVLEPEWRRLLAVARDETNGARRVDAFRGLVAGARVVAVELARTLDSDQLLSQRALGLLAFPERSALHRRLSDLGLAPDVRGHDLEGCLPHAIDHVVCKTSRDPVGHDGVAARWGRSIAPELDTFLFEEIPALHPDCDPTDDGRVHGVHRLRAFLEGRCVEARLAASGSWLDLMGLVGFVNTLLELRGSERRVVVLDERAESATVLAAPISAIRGLADCQLWVRPLL